VTTSITVGTIRITALNDGVSRLPPMMYPGLDFGGHPELLENDGLYDIPAGCFLIQGDTFTILVDAGIGPVDIPFPADLAAAAGLTPPPEFIAEGGRLPDELAAAGVAPDDVTTVLLTHLHGDHVGWVAPGGTPFFPNAEVVYGAADWDALIAPASADDPARIGMEAAKAAGVLRGIDAPTVEIAPGVTALHTPGHTPGHYAVRVASGGDEVHLIGDTVHHALQLTDTGISFLTDVDTEQALQTRKELFARVADAGVAIGMAHLPGLDFQRITEAGGRTWTDA
jgi:glyoxylase-like metal-dependent hydrolase (beta-lactamase superfamily II)